MKRKRYEWNAILDWIRGYNGGALNLRGANLEGSNFVRANLEGSNLEGAYMRGADMRGADMRGADMRGADMRGANLEGSNLVEANLARANLEGSSLAGANLDGAYLYGTNLVGANLHDAIMNWSSHDLIAERLRQAAGDDPLKRMAAGYVLMSRSWCWSDLLVNAPDIALDDETTLKEWSLKTMRAWVKAGDYAPQVLRDDTLFNAEVE
jgi:uncharacterized protein YjbI with pentapeptide repeats